MSTDTARPTGGIQVTDTKMIVVSIVGTGLATITVIVAFTAIIAGGFNARFDDLNSRIDDLNSNVNSRIDDLNSNVNSRMDEIETDIRELRALVIDAIKGETAAD